MANLTPDGPSIYPNCGDPSAYYRHLRNKTPTCRRCKDAVAAKIKTWRHANGINKGQIIPDTVIKEHGIKVRA